MNTLDARSFPQLNKYLPVRDWCTKSGKGVTMAAFVKRSNKDGKIVARIGVGRWVRGSIAMWIQGLCPGSDDSSSTFSSILLFLEFFQTLQGSILLLDGAVFGH